jgi:hypothetical protein
VELEAHGQIAPTVGKNEEKTVQKAAKSRKSGLFIPHCEIWRFSKPQVRQAASLEYTAKGFSHSLGRKGNCWDNAPMEKLLGFTED